MARRADGGARCEDGQTSFLVGYRRGAKSRWIERGQASSASGYSFVVGILLALLIAAGAFILLVSQQ
jgi:hypothetical protein